MSSEAAAAFAERLKNDESFANSLAEAATPQDRLEIARAAGFDLSPDDVEAVKSALGISELSDDDLEKVAGGIGTTTVVILSIPTPAIVSALI